MKKLAVCAIVSIVSFLAYSQTNWDIDLTKSKVTFIIRGPFGSDVDGILNSPTGRIVFDPSFLENASFNVELDPSSINTDIKKRDVHLRKKEFFDVLKYKTITFNSTKVEKSAAGYSVTGNLKIKDITKLVKITFSFVKNGNIGTWKGRINLNRRDYAIGNLTPNTLAGDEVRINIELVAINK